MMRFKYLDRETGIDSYNRKELINPISPPKTRIPCFSDLLKPLQTPLNRL